MTARLLLLALSTCAVAWQVMDQVIHQPTDLCIK